MWISFENELGVIRMTGGGESTWRLIAAEGLEPVQYDAETVRMSGREGQTTSSLSSLARTISLKGDIAVNNSSQVLSKAAEILSGNGYLKISKDTKKRKIPARCTAFLPERDYGGVRSFVMQFICDDPFFTDFESKEEYIRTVEKLLYGGFTLGEGIYFSLGSSSAVVNNMGTKYAEPIIEITNDLSNMVGNTITIRNETAEQTLIINAKLSGEDRLVIDIPQRKILLNDTERLDMLSEESFLSSFYLLSGKNLISVDTGSNSDRLTVKCIFDNRYIEAMV